MGNNRKIDIVSAPGEVNYLEEIKGLSDKNKKHLGMMPYSALEQSYQRGEIFIATVNDKFAGYLLYRIVPRYRRISITHLCIDQKFRRGRLPRLLIDSLKAVCTSLNYNGIGLNCRRDYAHAAQVWKNNLFSPIGEKPSRGSDNSKSVTKWWWDNASREDLFGDAINDTELVHAVVDMNVLINLKQHNATVLHLLNDSLIEEVEFCVGRESLIEIDRHEEQGVRNEMREFASKFSALDFKEDVFNEYVRKLKNHLPHSTDQEISDIRQLAQTLSAGKDVFITADNRLLNRAQDIFEAYELNVIHPSSLWMYLDEISSSDAYQPIRLSGTSINLRKARVHEIQSIGRKFLHANERKPDFIAKLRELVSDIDSSEVLVVSADESMLAVIAFTNVCTDESIVRIFRVLDVAIAYTLSAQIINLILNINAKTNRSKVLIADCHSSLPKNLAYDFGFREINNMMFKKQEFGVITKCKLPLLMQQTVTTSELPNIHLSDYFEEFKDKPLELEKALWPIKAVDLDVPIYVIPIRAHWAMQLFDDEIASEDMFGSDPSLAFNIENVYYSATSQALKAPGRLVWYVSRTKSDSPLSGSIRAVSYLDDVEVGNPKNLYRKHKRLGIYDWKDVFSAAHHDLDKELRALIFSRTELLKTPITLEEFSSIRIACGNAKPNLAGPLKIDIETFKHICDRLY